MKTIPIFLACCALAGSASGQAPCPPPVPPAAIVDVSSYLINAIVERPVCRSMPVHDTIIDAEVFGMGQTRGVVQARTMADANRAWIDFVFMGTSLNRTVGVQAPARVNTETLIAFELHQPVTIDGKNLRTWTPLAWVKAQTKLLCITNLKGEDDSPVVGMARLQFFDDKNEAETIAARKAEARLKMEFARDFLPEIEKAARKLNNAWKSLNWLGAPLQPLCWSSTEKYVRLQAGQLAAGLAAPPEVPASADFALRIHQSALKHIAQKQLAGKTFGPFDLAELHQTILGVFGGSDKAAKAKMDSMEQLLKQLGVAPLTITFVAYEPVSFQFTDGGMTLALHAKSFKAGKDVYPARDVIARYRIEAQAKEIVLVRDGPVRIETAGPYDDLEPARKKEVEIMLQQNFNLFLPQRLRLPTMNLGSQGLLVVPSQADARGGWLLLAWTREGKCR